MYRYVLMFCVCCLVSLMFKLIIKIILKCICFYFLDDAGDEDDDDNCVSFPGQFFGSPFIKNIHYFTLASRSDVMAAALSVCRYSIRDRSLWAPTERKMVQHPGWWLPIHRCLIAPLSPAPECLKSE